jgi:hypothetical protein
MDLTLGDVQVPNETLDQAVELGTINSGTEVVGQGSLGTGPAGAADVEWYSFVLDQPARIASELSRGAPTPSFRGVLNLFNNDPWDSGDPYDADGHRLLDQVEANADDGVASFDQVLGPGTYYLAVSGAGNLDFHPLVAASGLPGSTGQYDLKLDVSDAGLGAFTGPWVVSSDPAPNSSLCPALRSRSVWR